MKSLIVLSSVNSFVNSCLFSLSALLRATITSSDVPRIASVLTGMEVASVLTGICNAREASVRTYYSP